MDYEVDRQRTTVLADEQPSLKEMYVPSLYSRGSGGGADLAESRVRRATHALRYLKRRGSKGKGFFLMIEGARIDMAA